MRMALRTRGLVLLGLAAHLAGALELDVTSAGKLLRVQSA